MASNDDDRRQRRKQGGVVGAAASKTRVPPKARCGCLVPQPGRSGSHSKSFIYSLDLCRFPLSHPQKLKIQLKNAPDGSKNNLDVLY